MTRLWIGVVAVAVATWTMKAGGPLILGRRELPRRVRGVIAVLAPVLLAALLVTDLGGPRWSAVSWTQLVGVGAVGVTRLFKVPMLAAVLCGAAVTALLRFAVA